MKYRACIGNLLSYSADKHAAIKELRKAGYFICSDAYQTYIECDSIECADLVECLNFNV